MTPEGYLLTRTALAWKGIEALDGLLDSLPNYGSATNVEGSSPAATSSIRTTARPSPRPAPAARPLLIARNGWKQPERGIENASICFPPS